jgi:hypothetical protein
MTINCTLHIQANTHPTILVKSINLFYPCCFLFLDLETLVSCFPLITNLFWTRFSLYTLFGHVVTSVSGTSL